MKPAKNHLSERIQVGMVSASGVHNNRTHQTMDERISKLVSHRAGPLSESEDAFRKACRDMLRIQSYKPTGRGKPASEYLLRTASERSFPRINPVADINNYISLAYLVPVSLWDADKIDADSWLFRAGLEDERFVFNPSGQSIGLRDLATGFAVSEGVETPIVTPVKDCRLTKTDGNTRNIAAAVYYPASWNGVPELPDILMEFSGILKEISDHVESAIIV